MQSNLTAIKKDRFTLLAGAAFTALLVVTIWMCFAPGFMSYDSVVQLRISVKVISGFGERDQGRKVVLRGQEIVA